MNILRRLIAVLGVAGFMVIFAFGLHYAYEEFIEPRRAAEAAEIAPPAPLSIREAETAIVNAAEVVMPAVVSVETKQTVQFRNPFGNDPFFKRLFPDREHEAQGLGSGVIVDTRGYVLTNNHVVDGADEILVRLEDGRELTAEVLGRDPRLDVAVLKLKGDGPFPTAPIGNSDELRVGMFVLAIGTPFNRNLSQTVTMGIVSALSRSGFGIEELENFIQTDAAINMGNSGGPLVNLRGEVVGINVAIHTAGGASSAGVGFAIPINSARHSFESIISIGRVIHGYIGVSIQNITDELRRSFDLETSRGALVTEVIDDGPADKAGIESGDVIIEFDGRPVRNSFSLTDAVSRTNVGEKAKIKYIRDGRERSADVVIAERPANADGRAPVTPREEEGSLKKLGIAAKVVEGSEAKRLNLPGGAVVITAVAPGSLAERAEFKPGMAILKVNGVDITSVSQLAELVEKSGRYRFLVRHEGGNFFIPVIIE